MYVKEQKKNSLNPKLLDYWMKNVITEKVKINNSSSITKTYNKLENFTKTKNK